MNELTLAEAEFIAYEVAQQLMTSEGPMPQFADRPPHKLETVLTAPFASYGGKEIYPSVAEKAAVLFYSCCKGHPFPDGNKRMAVVLTSVFLLVNGWWVREDPIELYGIALAVAKSKPKDRDRVIGQLIEGIQTRLITIEDMQNLVVAAEAAEKEIA